MRISDWSSDVCSSDLNFPVYGRIADGWLLSSDFRPNDELLELRWVWKAAKAWQLDARARRREEVDLRAAPPAPRRRPLPARHLAVLRGARHEPSPGYDMRNLRRAFRGTLILLVVIWLVAETTVFRSRSDEHTYELQYLLGH